MIYLMGKDGSNHKEVYNHMIKAVNEIRVKKGRVDEVAPGSRRQNQSILLMDSSLWKY